MSEARYQLIDRDDGMPEMVDSDTIEELAESGRLEDWHRVLDTLTLATLTIAEIFGREPTAKPDAPALATSQAPAAPPVPDDAAMPAMPPQPPKPPTAADSGGVSAARSGPQASPAHRSAGNPIPEDPGYGSGADRLRRSVRASGPQTVPDESGFGSGAQRARRSVRSSGAQAIPTTAPPAAADNTARRPGDESGVGRYRRTPSGATRQAPSGAVHPDIRRSSDPDATMTSLPDGAVAGSGGALTIGSVWNGYRIDRALGKGGMGEVYHAVREHDGAQVAIKVLPASSVEDSSAMARFEREAKALTKIDSPNVVSIHFVGQIDGGPCVVMDHVEGQTLEEMLESGHRFTVDEVIDIGKQIGRALWAAAKHHIVHRDIKPANLMLTPNGTVVVLDFGLAKFTRDDSGLTKTGEVFGTVRYMSPEQVRGETCDHRSDLYSLGATLYHLLAGRPPFVANEIHSLLRMHLEELPQSLRDDDPRIPDHVEAAIIRCLAKDPLDRHGSSLDLARELEDANAAARSTAMVPALTAGRQGSPRKKSSTTLGAGMHQKSKAPIIAGVAVVALAAAGAGAWFAFGQQPVPEPQPQPPVVVDVDPEPIDDPEPEPIDDPEPEPIDDPEPDPIVTRDQVTSQLASYVEAMAASQWQSAWETGRAVAAQAPDRARAERLRLPLDIQINSAASLLIDLDERGQGPQVLRYAIDEDHRLVAWQPGHAPASIGLAEHGAAAWAWQPNFAPAPALERIVVLPDTPTTAPGGSAELLLCPLPAGQMAALGAHDQRGLRLPGGDQLGPALTAPASYGDTTYIIHRDGLALVSTMSQAARTIPFSAAMSSVHSLAVIEHELVPGAAKAIAVTNAGEIHAWTIDDRGAAQLTVTNLGRPITGGLDAMATDTGASLVAIAAEDVVHLYDGGTVGPNATMDRVGEVVVGQTVARPPVIAWYAGGPAVVIAADDGQVTVARPQAAGPLQTATWQIGRAPAGHIRVLSAQQLALVGGVDGSLSVLDLSDRGQMAWSTLIPGFDAPVGAPLVQGDRVIVVDRRGRVAALSLASGAVLWQFALGLACSSGPQAYGSGAAVVTDAGYVAVLAQPQED